MHDGINNLHYSVEFIQGIIIQNAIDQFSSTKPEVSKSNRHF